MNWLLPLLLTSLVRPQYSTDCIGVAIAKRMKITQTENIPLPELKFASEITLQEFQDALEEQWGFRPAKITNAYAIKLNQIFLIDDAQYYQRNKRYIDDSVAHEVVHFYQVRYRGMDLGKEEFAELEAISEQKWFRETFMTPGPSAPSPCL